MFKISVAPLRGAVLFICTLLLLSSVATALDLPPAPNLTYPDDGAVIYTTTPTLEWEDITGYYVDYYNI
ncbi:MAG: hypothetical protein SVM80_02890, partial [Halobacteriota archaeon]|nr:hypothetical protein [Halobacteriota archaeon]